MLDFLWDGLALTVTSPTSSPRDTVVRVKMAEIRGGRKVQKVSGSRRFDLGVTGEQGCPGSYAGQANLKGGGVERVRVTERLHSFTGGCGVLCYLCGSIKAFLEHDANTPERRHDLPAGPQLTGARDAMTLTLHLHVVKDGLRMRG